jgi:hypothetical protein
LRRGRRGWYDLGMANIDKVLLKQLLEQFNALGPGGDAGKRNEILDEMQDAAGLAGKMVMERDILRKAEQILKGP